MTPTSTKGVLAASFVLAFAGCATSDSEPTTQMQQDVTGNLHPGAIQIDGPTAGADLHADVGVPLNPGATLDWVADTDPNSGPDCLGTDSIATCIEPNVTGAEGGTGHWNGVRIVDGIASGDADIFLTGGKENDTSTWNIGPGSVGSSKYDIVQAYLANNQDNLYFGMERRGNNGTTAFDFEFNQLAPMALETCVQEPNVPCRSVGDILFTFEMQGSGKSGSASPHIYTWDGSTYVEGAADGIISSINQVTDTAGGPWGHVDRHGDWVLGNLDRYAFAEASAPIELLPGVDTCGGKAFVQVRTRSSSTPNSDLKDTTRVFEFLFNSVVAEASLAPSCDQGFSFTASGQDADGNPITDPVCSWTFTEAGGAVLTSSECSGFMAAPVGTYSGEVEVWSAADEACKGTTDAGSVDVHPVMTVTADLEATCVSAVNYTATGGGSNPAGATYAWTFVADDGVSTTNPSTSTDREGAFTVGTNGVSYTGTVVATDARTDLVCTATASDSATPYGPISVDLLLTAEAQTCPTMTSDAATYTASVTGGDGNYAYAWTGLPCNGTICTIDPTDGDFCHDRSLYVTVTDGSGLCGAATSETETFAKVTVITASDNP